MTHTSILKSFVDKYKDEGSVHSAPVVQGIFNGTQERKGHVLYTPCKPVTSCDLPFVEDFTKIMYKTMIRENGIGLAANQIGIGLQMFIMEVQDSESNPRYSELDKVPFSLIINPVITKASKSLSTFWHGCLSAKGQKYGKLTTYESLKFKAKDVLLKTYEGEVSQMSAIIFQHEFRHLLGNLYLDQTNLLLSSEELEKETDIGLKEGKKPAPHLLADYQIGTPIEKHKTTI